VGSLTDFTPPASQDLEILRLQNLAFLTRIRKPLATVVFYEYIFGNKGGIMKKYIFRIIFLVMFFGVWFFAETGLCISEKRMKERHLNGTIDEKFLDEKGHMYPTIRISSLEEKVAINDRSDFYSFIQIGDSLLKKEGSLEIRVVRGEIDTVFTLDYDCQ
jgi:hypothetical protein